MTETERLREEIGKLARKRRWVIVEWMDAQTLAGWSDAIEAPIAGCVTMGFLIKRTRDKLIIAPTLGTQNVAADRTVIPRGMILSMRDVK